MPERALGDLREVGVVTAHQRDALLSALGRPAPLRPPGRDVQHALPSRLLLQQPAAEFVWIRLGFGRYTSEDELRTALGLIVEAADRQTDLAA